MKSDRIWYIDIKGLQEGPFSFNDLRRDARVTPDTLVRKAGSEKWVLIRNEPELKELFKDEENFQVSESEDFEFKTILDEELTLDARQFPPYFFWMIIALILLIYFLAQVYGK